MKEMKEDGGSSLRDELGITKGGDSSSAAKSLDDRLRELVNREPVMLFMKGLPSAPRCGFSRQIVEILDTQRDDNGNSIAYGAFNILDDEEVRQGLKKFR